jgi:hypothetical protein
MHWVTPKTAGRMLQSDNLVENEPVSLKTSPVNEKDVEAGYAAAAEDAEEDEAVYDPTPYNEVLYHCVEKSLFAAVKVFFISDSSCVSYNI